MNGVIGANEAVVNVTVNGQQGDLPDPVSWDANDGDIRQWVTEALRTGGVPGIPATNVNLADYVIERLAAKEGLRPNNQLLLRPKVAFGHI